MRAGQAKATEYRRKTPISTQTQQKEEGDMENITLSQDAVKGTWPLPKSISDPFQLRELSRQLDVRLEERLAERKHTVAARSGERALTILRRRPGWSPPR